MVVVTNLEYLNKAVFLDACLTNKLILCIRFLGSHMPKNIYSLKHEMLSITHFTSRI